MTYKDIFGQAFSDIYTRFPLSDTETICRSVKARAAGGYTAKNKKRHILVPLIAVLSSVTALTVTAGLLLGSGVLFGQEITTPGYSQMQAEIEAARSLDKHNITDEERDDTGSVPLGISRVIEDYKVSLLWYKFDGTDAIIKYKVTCSGDIPEDLNTLPRPTSNYINADGGFDSLPSFETYDIAGKDSNTFTMYSKLTVVIPPVYELPVGIDNRRADGVSSPYMFTAKAAIPEDRQPIFYYTDITLNVPESGRDLRLTHITINPLRIDFTFDEVTTVSDDSDSSTITGFMMSAKVMMKNGEPLKFDSFGSGSNIFSCLLRDENIIDPREVDYIEISGRKVYVRAENEVIEIPDDGEGETAADDIILYSSIYGNVRLDEVCLQRKEFSISFSREDTDVRYPIGGYNVSLLRVVLLFHDGSIMDISDKTAAGGESVVISDNTRVYTLSFDLSQDQVAPRYVAGVYINDNLVPLENVEQEGTDEEMRRYVRTKTEAADTDTVSPVPIGELPRKS